MTCRNYIPGPNGDCQRCGEMRVRHAVTPDGEVNIKDALEGANQLGLGEMRAGHAGGVVISKDLARRIERHLAAYGQAELDRRELSDIISK